MARRASAGTQARLGKSLARHRDRVQKAMAPALARDVAAYFLRLEAALERALAGVLDTEEKARGLKESSPLPDVTKLVKDEPLHRIVSKAIIGTSEQVYEQTSSILAVTEDFSLNARNIRASDIGLRVTAIGDETRARLASTVKSGIDSGKAPSAIAKDLIEQVGAWAGKGGTVAHSRAMVIARTETAIAYSQASVRSYRDSGLVDNVICIDNPECGWKSHDDPEKANDTVRSFQESTAYPISHPNCVRTFAPNVSAREREQAETLAPDESRWDNPKDFGDERYGSGESEHEKWAGQFTPDDVTLEETQALSAYQGASYRGLNENLRAGAEIGEDLLSARQKGYQTHMDSLISRSVLPDAVVVHRGVGSGQGLFQGQAIGTNLIGQTFTDYGYASASLSSRGAFPGVRLQLTVPKGYNAVPVNHQAIGAPGSKLILKESEVVLPRGTKIVVDDVHQQVSATRNSYGYTRVVGRVLFD